MNTHNDDLLADIDATLQQLVENAEALKAAKLSGYCEHEEEVLERARESLLARLIHRQALLDCDKKQKTLVSMRQEAVARKVITYAKMLAPSPQNRARRRRARSKS